MDTSKWGLPGVGTGNCNNNLIILWKRVSSITSRINFLEGKGERKSSRQSVV